MSWQLALLRGGLRYGLRPLVSVMRDVPQARRSFLLAARLGFRRVRGTAYTRAEGPLAPGLWVTTDPQAGQGPLPGLVVYFHGGAYVMGAPATYWAMAARLAWQSRRRLFLPSYPLAPEHPAPAAFDAARGLWDALMAQGHAPDQIVLAGDSAGGGLALALLAHVLGQGQRPAACVVFAPWTDMTLSGASLRENAGRDVMIPRQRLVDVRDMAVGDMDPTDPRISPLFARFVDCPPVFVTWSESELLRDDSVRLVAALRAQGATVETDVQPDAPHVWQLFQGMVPEANASLRRAADFIARALPSPPPAGS